MKQKATVGTPTRTTTGGPQSCSHATKSHGPSTPKSRLVEAHRTVVSSSTFLSRLPADVIRRKLPSMYHQFKELADVDITAEPMEVGPTCHYVMGGVEVDPDTGAAAYVEGLFAAGEVAGGMHGSNRLGGNSLSDLLVFGRRAGLGAADYVDKVDRRPTPIHRRRRRCSSRAAVRPFNGDGDENPYTVHTELQQTMNDLVGIIRQCRRDAESRLNDLRPEKRAAKSPSRVTDSSTLAGISLLTWTTCCWFPSASQRLH